MSARKSATQNDELLGKALDRTLLRRIFSYVWPYRAQLAVALALLPVVALLEVAQPYLLKKAIDEHIAVGRLAGLDRLGLFYFLALAGQYGAGLRAGLSDAAHRAARDERPAHAAPPARAEDGGPVLRSHAGGPAHDSRSPATSSR